MPDDLIDAVDSWPLRSAVISGDIEVVRKNLGLDEGARIDEEDKLGQTPLYCQTCNTPGYCGSFTSPPTEGDKLHDIQKGACKINSGSQCASDEYSFMV
ncbi:hypothetical protein QYM36_008901 [Artemia franciscana]|uniref:Uncharacterized protein n=1 Tax=Artemia franciscana TaxID=6661 RepID=A0AA88HYE4_ARTSF|nr:hypothetical protein QYM36_008901 [Artemia franciscana]